MYVSLYTHMYVCMYMYMHTVIHMFSIVCDDVLTLMSPSAPRLRRRATTEDEFM